MKEFYFGYTATPTKINLFLRCPREYWYRYINSETKGKQPEKGYFTLGHHVHNTLRDFFDVAPETRTEDVLLSLLETHWSAHSGKAAGFTSEEEEAKAKARAVAMLKLFMEKEDFRLKPFFLPSKEGKIPGYEWVEVDKGVAVGGIVDRVDEDPDGKLHIIDYKTGKWDKPDAWQLPMYAVLMGRRLQRPIERTSYLFLEHGKRIPEEVNPQKNAETIMRVLDVVAKIPKTKNKEDFVCPEGDNCRHCEYLRELGYDPKTGLKLDAPAEPADPYSPDLPF